MRCAMTRTHRVIHRIVWPVLALLVASGFVMALHLRPPPDPPLAVEPAR
jgi:hypothetical protein